MSANSTEKGIRVQTLLSPTLYGRLQDVRKAEDRSESKMAAILIEEALDARANASHQPK